MPSLNSLTVNGLRNLDSVSISLSPSINIFYGINGSGKTSLLESVSLLGLGRSFRNNKTRSLIHYDKDELVVFSDILADENIICPVGIKKTKRGDSQIKIAGRSVNSAAELAQQLPLVLINANSFQLIEGSPLYRKQFLDWMVFHVKPEFAALWRAAEKLVKQRNSLLRRDKITLLDIEPWDKELAKTSTAIDVLREEVFTEFLLVFESISRELFPSSKNLSITLDYYRGWDKEQDALSVLKQNFERDYRKGYTHAGPQRAEIKIQCENKKASEVLSRGQEKTLVGAMMLAQSAFYRQKTGKSSVFLIDDLLAELDKTYSQAIAKKLIEMKCQVLVTGVEKSELLAVWQKAGVEPALFHVEQGNVKSE